MKHSKLFKVFFFVLALVATERFCRSQTDGFRLTKAINSYSYSFKDREQVTPQEVFQSFHFFGSGVQFYVFVGEDQKTILKLFKHHHMGPSTGFIKKYLPDALTKSIVQKREKRMHHLFTSVAIAHNELPQETGVFYTHLSKTNNQLGTIPLYDPLGICHQVDLDRAEFLLQKRAIPLAQYLDPLFKNGCIDQAISAMKGILTLIECRSEMGIKKKDGKVCENCGYIGPLPAEIDIGSYVIRSRSTCKNPHKKTRLKATLGLLLWVKKHYPENLKECHEKLLDENLL
ncbi:MAG: hypothetical protein KR126chlam1_00373 [Chlamydiae bacterium]|nr:hypothetical protein [Chlamydiota bacterium]